MARIYTRTGDTGETSLFDGQRVLKSHIQIEVLGDLDELNAVIGMCPPFDLRDYIQNMLLVIGAMIAGGRCEFGDTNTLRLEEAIDKLSSELPPLTRFILPRGPVHLARTVCRRAERHLFIVEPPAEVLKFINRLSDYLFMVARTQSEDVIWN